MNDSTSRANAGSPPEELRHAPLALVRDRRWSSTHRLHDAVALRPPGRAVRAELRPGQSRVQLVRPDPRRRPRERQLTFALERPTYVQERQPDHVPGGVVLDRVALGRLQPMRRLAWRADAQVEDVTARVVMVMVELDTGDRDGHVLMLRGGLSWTKAVTIHAGVSLKSTTTLSQRRGSSFNDLLRLEAI